MNQWIEVRGARTHNLKSIDLKIPKNKVSVILGPSGSGKSSLALDTLYAEGSRRYLESLSLNARQVLGGQAHADVDQIIGLSPSIELKAHQVTPGARSSVGTLTEIDSLLRTLFFQGGVSSCPHCQRPLKSWTIAEVVDEILSAPVQSKTLILAPKVAKEYEKDQWIAQGMIRVRYQGEIQMLEDLEWENEISLEIVVDRFKIDEKNRTRIWEACETAFEFGSGVMAVLIEDELHQFSQFSRCVEHDYELKLTSRRNLSFNSDSACKACQGLGEISLDDGRRPTTCKKCQGNRLSSQWKQLKYDGLHLGDWSHLNFNELESRIQLRLNGNHTAKWELPILKELLDRVGQVVKMGLDYLHLYRSAPSLSGGEYQRLRIATQIGSGMSGVCYFLDEPLNGLHYKDQEKLWSQLRELAAQNNTLVLVEHSRFAISQADYLVEMGPGSAHLGGQCLYTGDFKTWLSSGTPASKVWSNYLPEESSSGRKFKLEFKKTYTLKKSYIEIHEQSLNVIAGVSGSGKSTLMSEVIYPFFKPKMETGETPFNQLIYVNSQPLRGGRRSSPASLTGMMDQLRKLFAKLPESKIRGYTAARFSLNKKGGRCEHCLGEGVQKVELGVMPDSCDFCESCQGTGYNKPTLEILFKGHHLGQLLNFEVSQAASFFRDIPEMAHILSVLEQCGLGHLKLGTSSRELSGGEMQRLKLVRDLKNIRRHSKALILLDEPSRGLFLSEMSVLREYFSRLNSDGHCLVIVDHHPDLILSAHHLIEVGPLSGPLGGKIIRPSVLREDTRQWIDELLD